ncbi:type 1 glutamine amidotransferase [Streptomyces apricus]|uniref:Type 1 glutamine amidotransferase n=1 Tax=Streptomyces apricus TaxID=1828112 RepID=A0A5B0AP93_9ACTN|nr:type 1 glutamine amidotransferase [Streptomyces apricus]KAA0931833.1 type 1 glutamine amidotransferase [Streptomyces apricus]
MASGTEVRVLAVRNAARSGAGRLPSWFADEGITLVEVDGARAPDRPDGWAAVLLLGGGFLPDDDARAPWLPAQRALARRAVADGVPLLGICLGAQVLALAAGGTVRGAHGEPERGSCTVALRAEAATDPLFRWLPRRFPVIQNHRDQITRLPPGAVHLAANEACPVQAFRLGRCAWGVQFHPEADADRLLRWDEAALAGEGLDLAGLRERALAAEPASAAAARALVAAFAAVAREHAGSRTGVAAGPENAWNGARPPG